MRVQIIVILIAVILGNGKMMEKCSYGKERILEMEKSQRKMMTTSSKWHSTLTEKQRDEYYKMIELKQSFAASMEFLPRTFSPELNSYWTSLDYVVYIFLGIGAFPFAFVIFYFIVRFGCKKCRGPEKASQVTKSYRNITWLVFMITSIVLIILLLTIVIISSLGNSKVNTSFDTSKDFFTDAKKSYTEIENLAKEVDKHVDIKQKISQSLLQIFKEGIDQYTSLSKERTNDAISKENKRNLMNVIIFLVYIAIIALAIFAFIMRWKPVLMGLSIFTFLSMTIIVIYAGYNSKYYFYYSDLCSKVYSAMYKNEFPVANQGLGYYVNCFEKKSKSNLYTINYQISLLKNEIKNNETYNDLLKTVNQVEEKYITPLIECQNVYNVVTDLETEFCKEGMSWFKQLIELYLWVLLFVFILGIALNRIEILVWKKKVEIESMVENLEALY